ncbi:MFS transporter [Comamonas sp. JC664]
MFAHNETTFYVLRFLLGVAEAGFFPGVILYLTYWFPAAHRAQAMGFFYFGAPLAFIFGSPLSGLLLELDGMGGWHGWQWLFAVEGLMAVAVGIWSYFYLTNRPADAQWLTADERRQVQDIIDSEERAKGGHQHSLLAAMCQPRVLYLALVYLLIQASVYGVVFYLPSQVAGLLAPRWVCKSAWSRPSPGSAHCWPPGGCPALPSAAKNPAVWPAMTLLVAAIGMAASVSFSSPLLGVAALCFAAAGFIAVQRCSGPFQPTRWQVLPQRAALR